MTPAAVRRWLRSGAGDVIRIVPARHERERPQLGLREGLPRWRRRIDRRRAAVLVRRWLLLGLALAVALELIAATAGVSGRGLWLAPPGAVILIGVAVGLRRRVGPAEAALLLDRQLGLSERLTTALELALPGATGSPLGALVLGEADAAIDRSLERSRASDPSAVRERLAVLAAAILLVGAIALGGVSRSHPRRLAAPGASARVEGESTATTTPAHEATGQRPPAPAARAKTGSQAHQPTASSGTASAGHRPQPTPSATGRGHSAAASARSRAQSRPGQTPTSSAGAGSRATAGTGHGEASSPSRTAAGAAGTTAHSETQGPTQSPSRAPSATGLSGGATRAESRPGSTSAPARSKTGSAHGGTASSEASRAASRGAAAAGAAPGQATAPSSRKASAEAGGTATLPIQSGYAPSRSLRHAPSAVGEGAAGHDAQGQGESATSAVGEGEGAASFAFIPLIDAGVSSPDTALLLDYFGPFDSLASESW